MRTANKLLLSFVALIVLLMLFSDIVLWANFKKGRNGNDKLRIVQRNNGLLLKPVKVLKISGEANTIWISHYEQSVMTFNGDSTGVFTLTQTNDTMFLQMHKHTGNMTISLASVNTIILSESSSIAISDFDLPKLDIQMGDHCDAELRSMNIGSLNVDGGESSSLELTGEGSEHRVDSFRLTMKKNSNFKSLDVPYLHTDIKLDSIQTLEMTGRSLNVLKEIK
jgi:hypothetical protein